MIKNIRKAKTNSFTSLKKGSNLSGETICLNKESEKLIKIYYYN